MSGQQQYCLRWNNHRSNLLTVFDQLLQNEAFTDVTLACEGGTSVKCHKMVLAACSSYFQCLFTELPCRHPVVVLKDVRYGEMKAILEYMYRGEVNVAQDQLAGLLKVAEALKVKGLVEENGGSSSPGGRSGVKCQDDEGQTNNTISTSTSAHHAQPPSSSNDESPPHSTVHQPGFSKMYMYGSKAGSGRSSGSSWPGVGNTGLSPVPPPSSSLAPRLPYDPLNSADIISPLRRKKLSTLLMSRDTPILRTVLGQGQGQADSSQPMPLVCRPDSGYEQGNRSPFTNGGSTQDAEKNIKAEPSSGDAPSPYTDLSNMDEENVDRQSVTGYHSSTPHSIYGETKGGISSGIATYVPTPKPEWKRYKQYTRNDIMSAIEAVRSGMSALQAARKFGVPSRTLYDKVKKLGITTSRPFRRGSNGTPTGGFPYGLSGPPGTGSMVYGTPSEEEIKYSPQAVIDHAFLHHALDAHNIKREDIEREAMAAMVAAASTETTSQNSLSPGHPRERSVSPTLIKYAHRRSVSPDQQDDSNQVEDLSVSGRKAEGSRVIMPPMSQAAATIITAAEPQDVATD